MPGSRPSTPRGPRSRGARPGPRPGQRAGATRPRPAPARPLPVRPRFTGRAAVLVLVLAVLAVSYASSMRAYLQQKEHLTTLRASIVESRTNIAELKREQRRWQDPAYVEAQARERFGWVQVGEVGYQVIGEDGKPLGHDDSLSDPKVLQEAQAPLWWQSAWKSVVAAGNPEDVKLAPVPVDEIRAPKAPKG